MGESEHLAREGQVLREALGARRGRRSQPAPAPSWRPLAQAGLGLMVLAGLAWVALDQFRARPPSASGYVRRELVVEFRLPSPIPEGAVASVVLVDVPATLTRPVKALEKGSGDEFRLVWTGELMKAPQRIRGRLQAPGWQTEESSEVVPSGEGESLAVSLPPLVLRRKLNPKSL